MPRYILHKPPDEPASFGHFRDFCLTDGRAGAAEEEPNRQTDRRPGDGDRNMEQAQAQAQPMPGDLNWRLSAHPLTLLFFLGFRIGSLLMYLFGVLFIKNFILVFIITLLLLSADFYYLKNIAGRRLVGLRWWNEVNMQTGESHWVFESSDPNTRVISATDKRFFWLGLYSTPALWIGLAVLAIIRLQSVIWLSLVAIALILTITNTLAFSRCDRFSQASSFASNALSGGIAGNFATGMFGRIFR